MSRSRWAETFARLSGASDTLDTMRHSAEQAAIVSQSVHSVMAAAPRSEPSTDQKPLAKCRPSAAEQPIRAAERAAAIWDEAENEDAAIVEHDGSIPSEWCAGIAQLDPDRPPADVPPVRWLRFIDDGRLFLEGPFCTTAAAFGWDSHDLFGCDPVRPFARIDKAGLVWFLNGDRLIALTGNTATIETPTLARQTFRCNANEANGVPAWELQR